MTRNVKFNPGDKVKLISGGPDMTVRGLHYDVLANQFSKEMYDCIWFEPDQSGKQEVHYCPFYNYELVKTNNN